MTKSKSNYRKHAFVTTERSRTEQDAGPGINELVNRYMHSGQPIPQAPWQTGEQPTHEDVANARNLWAVAQSHFEDLPSNVRDHFDNDPLTYFDEIELRAPEIAENGLSAVLKDILLESPETSGRDDLTPSGVENAQNGATEDEPGTEQTS